MLFANLIDNILSGLVSGIGEIVGAVLNIIWVILCQIIYPLLSWIFSVFTKLYSVNNILLEGKIHEIYSRVTIIITIIMAFYITFEFVKYTVSPDTITDKEKGAVPLFVRIILVIIMLAFVPTIFSVAQEFQLKVLNSNVIPRVIMGTDYSDTEISGAGREFVGDVYSAFIRADCDNVSFHKCDDLKKAVSANIAQVKKGNFFLGSMFTQLDPGIELNGFLAVLFGCFMIYVIFLYCKDVALRHIQLIYLQIIAPIAIMSYIAPKKDGMFKKWLKQCTTTYLDIFIRVAVLYFVILICGVLADTYSLDEIQYAGDGRQVSITIYLFLIAGLLMFLKKAPKLLEELFPKSGAASIGFGFSAKERQGILGAGISGISKNILQNAEPIARAYGAIRGGVEGYKGFNNKKDKLGEKYKDQSKWRRRIDRAKVAGKAAAKGFDAGQKGFSEVAGVGQKVAYEATDVVLKGGDVKGYYSPHASQKIKDKWQLQIDALEREVKLNESQASVMKTLKTAQDSAEDRSRKKIEAREQKITIPSQADAAVLTRAIGELKLNKYGIDISEVIRTRASEGKTTSTSDIYTILEAKANSAKSASAAFNQELVKATVEGDADKVERLKAIVAEKEAEEVELKTLAEKTLKELERYAFTRTLNGGIDVKEQDPVLEDNIKTIKQTLDNVRNYANSSQEIRAKLEQELGAILEQIMNYETEVTDFETYDAIQGALTSYASKLNDENSALKEQIRKIQDSDEFVAANANTSGKK